MENKKRKKIAKALPYIVMTGIVGIVAMATANHAVAAVEEIAHTVEINSAEYQAERGRWDSVAVPEDLQINAIHSVMLPTGKVLLIAGSGNDQVQFDAGTFSSIVYDPNTKKSKMIDTPIDMFCAGHASLPNGNTLVAGGTRGYEVLAEDLKRAGGSLSVYNEDTTKALSLPKGTLVTGVESGLKYRTDAEITVPRAKIEPADGRLWPGDRNVYVESVDKGKAGIWLKEDRYIIEGHSYDGEGRAWGLVYQMAMEKKEYQGLDTAYEFNPWTETYEKVDPMKFGRWYPTLTEMSNGHVITISGIDGGGKVLEGQTEIYNPTTQKWTERKDLRRNFPTYPSIFQTGTPGILFSAGPSTGYGPADQGREPGYWNLEDNSFEVVPGLRAPGILETAAATWLGTVNEQRIVVVGGGGIGESEESTGRIDVIDLDGEEHAFTPYADLPQGTRYPNILTLPTGDLFITNGSQDYRGRGGSNILKSYMLDSEDGTLIPMADPKIGRNYHASALLMPNGQILVAGSDPLFGDKDNTTPGKFEKQIEIYTPPYLFNSDSSTVNRPVIDEAGVLAEGTTLRIPYVSTVSDLPVEIEYVRLARPGAVTHVTDTNQRLVELDVIANNNGIVTARVPDNPALVPPGYYMLYLIDSAGVPSTATWVKVTENGTVTSHVMDASHH